MLKLKLATTPPAKLPQAEPPLRLLCPCGTSFNTCETQPTCPDCGGVLQITYKRRPPWLRP
jgi:hypothetical protein